MTQEDSIHFRILNEIGIINQLAQSIFERVMPEGMTLAQFTVLNHFVRLGGVRSPAELAQAFQVTRGTMTSTLQKLEMKGLIAIDPDPKDGRSKHVSLTAQGRSMRHQCIRRLEPEIKRLSELWPLKEAAPLLKPLGTLRALLDRVRD